jgi:hypothetical protein
MTQLAKVFSIDIWNSLELMKMMLDCNHVSQKDLDAVFDTWNTWMNLPWQRYIQDYVRMFPQSRFNM